MSAKPAAGLKAGRPSKARAAAPVNVFIEPEKPVRVNFDLPRDEHTKLKIHAAKAGKSIADVLREFINSIE